MQKETRLQSLDLFKGIAMVMILLVHLNQSFTSYLEPLEFFEMGCQLFFVASGFGACLSLCKRNESESFWSSTKSFYLSRIKSIVLPVYLTILLFQILTVLSTKFWQPVISITCSQRPLDILCNMLFLNGLLPDCNNNVYPGAWFIGTTMALYALAPYLYLSLRKVKRYQKLLLALLFTLICYVILYAHSLMPGGRSGWLEPNSLGYNSFLNQMPCFLLVMLLYFDYQEGISSRCVFFSVIGFLCSLGLTLYFFYESPSPFDNILSTLCMGFAGYYLLRLLLIFERQHTYSKKVQIPEQFGKNSLYIFLTHTLIVWYLIDLIAYLVAPYGIDFGKRRYLYLMIPVCFALTFGLGILFKKACCFLHSRLFQKKQ